MSLLSSWIYPLTTDIPAYGTEVIANLDMIADKIGRVSGAGLLDNDNINPVPGKELEQAKISGLVAALAAKMPLAGGIFTGNVDLNYATPQLRIMQSGVDKVRLTSAGIFADTVSENTAGTGVTVDGVLVKDGGVGLTATGHLSAGALTAGVKHELKDSGMTESTLLRLAADDADPWALVVGNDTYSSIATDGLAFQVKNTGQVVLRVKGTGADLVLGTDVEPSAVKLGANGSLALVRAYISANGNNIGLFDPTSPNPEDVVFIGKHSENYLVQMYDVSLEQYKLAFAANPAGEVGIGTFPVAGVGMKVAGTTVTTGTVNARDMVADGAKLDTAHQGENHTGDVTSAGLVTTIATDAVNNTKLANVPTATFKGRTTAGTGDPEDLTVSQAKTLLGLDLAVEAFYATWTGNGTDNRIVSSMPNGIDLVICWFAGVADTIVFLPSVINHYAALDLANNTVVGLTKGTTTGTISGVSLIGGYSGGVYALNRSGIAYQAILIRVSR